MAQIDTTDQNWNLVFHDDFTGPGRGWNTNSFKELAHPNILWVCKSTEHACPVMTGDAVKKTHVYQPSQCVFTDNTLKLIGQYTGADLSCTEGDFIIPNDKTCNHCTETHRSYFTGIIQSITKFTYGYFEIRCKMPVHEGVHTAFWLFGNGPSSYEEIDIWEYSEYDSGGDYSPYGYSSGIHHNPNSVSYYNAQKYGEIIYSIPENEPDVRQFHTYGCEWMPDYVKWYRDGHVVGEFHDRDHIPQFSKKIIVSYTIDMKNNIDPQWYGSDTLTIDYVKVYQMRTDCNSEILITNNSQIADFEHKMKKSVTIGTSETSMCLPDTTDVSFHAEEHITLNGVIEIPSGAKITLSTHECPNHNTNIIQEQIEQ